MKIILAVDKNFAIGKDNKLLFHIKKDLKHFKDTTLNSIVIMGRKTYESMGGALKNRTNVILSRNEDYKANDCLIFNNYKDILNFVEKNNDKNAFIIGGNEIVNIFLPYCDEAIITKVDAQKDADVYLHNFDEDDAFYLYNKSEVFSENGLDFTYNTYRRKKWKNYL